MNVVNLKKSINGLCVIGIAALSFHLSPVYALDLVASKNAMDAAVSFLESEGQQKADGSWGDNDEIRYVTTASVVEALQASNQYTHAYYDGIAWLENHATNNVDYAARKILALSKRGYGAGLELAILNNARHTGASGLGLSAHYTENTVDSALALRAAVAIGDAANKTLLKDYLVNSQQTESGWTLGEGDVVSKWATAEAVIALNALADPSLATAIDDGIGELNTIVIRYSEVEGEEDTVLLDDTILFARAALAVFQHSGLTSKVDTWVSELLRRQTAGEWDDSYTTALVLRTLAAITGTDSSDYATRVSITDQNLRAAINEQLGKNAFDTLNRGELALITILDLQGWDVSELTGLEFATNLQQLDIEGQTSTEAIAGLNNLTIEIHSDSDKIADVNDNCPLVANELQENYDGDAYGDACDADIDNDGMPTAWETTYALNNYNPSDISGDPDSDLLLNLEEYQEGTDPRDADTDGDGLADGVEVAYASEGLSPVFSSDASADFDQDNLSNADEIAWNTGINNPDSDQDGALDGDEVLSGRNPLLNEPVLVVIITSTLL